MSKLKIYHFYNGNGGGVHSVIKNLLRFSQNPEIENHIIHAINQQIHPSYKIEPMEGAASEQLCLYSPKDNFYHTCKKLAACLPDEKAVVIAHDWIELGMMSNLGLQNKVVYFLHGDYDYYYLLAQKHEASIDGFICVAENIFIKLKQLLVGNTSIKYHRFPVPNALPYTKKIDNSVVFVGRLEMQKGFHLIEQIAIGLTKIGCIAKWFIVGEGPLNTSWQKGVDVKFLGKLNNEAVLELLTGMQIIVLPSLLEGMPVSLIEAMKSGAVPLVNDIQGGIQELIPENGMRGFKVQSNSVEQYVQLISHLLQNKNLYSDIQNAAKKYAEENFNPKVNTIIIEKTFKEISSKPFKKKNSEKVYGSRLDKQWIPNFIVNFIRK